MRNEFDWCVVNPPKAKDWWSKTGRWVVENNEGWRYEVERDESIWNNIKHIKLTYQTPMCENPKHPKDLGTWCTSACSPWHVAQQFHSRAGRATEHSFGSRPGFGRLGASSRKSISRCHLWDSGDVYKHFWWLNCDCLASEGWWFNMQLSLWLNCERWIVALSSFGILPCLAHFFRSMARMSFASFNEALVDIIYPFLMVAFTSTSLGLDPTDSVFCLLCFQASSNGDWGAKQQLFGLQSSLWHILAWHSLHLDAPLMLHGCSRSWSSCKREVHRSTLWHRVFASWSLMRTDLHHRHHHHQEEEAAE